MKRSTKKFYSKFDQARILTRFFESHSVRVMVMKMYSDDNDVDMVVAHPNHYSKATKLLISEGWYTKNNMSKFRERDKDFFFHEDFPYFLHLHKYFSWNTVVYLDSKLLWKRKRQIQAVFVPSIEDELLIIAAHSLFENLRITREELGYGKALLRNEPDIVYMRNHAGNFSWESAVFMILDKLRENNPNLNFFELVSVRLKKVLKDLSQGKFLSIANELIAYMLVDLVWNHETS